MMAGGCKESSEVPSQPEQKYTLKVTVSSGLTGTPAAGDHVYTSGTEVQYSYAADSGYCNLTTLLDGVESACSGTITMHKNYELDISAVRDISAHWFFALDWLSGDCPFDYGDDSQFQCDIAQNGVQLTLTGDGGDFVFILTGALDPQTLEFELMGEIPNTDPTLTDFIKLVLVLDGRVEGNNLFGDSRLEFHFTTSVCTFTGEFAAQM